MAGEHPARREIQGGLISLTRAGADEGEESYAELRAEYEAEKERLSRMWREVAALTGSGYIEAREAYREEKARVKERYAAVRRPGRPPGRRRIARPPAARTSTHGRVTAGAPEPTLAATGLAREITDAFVEGGSATSSAHARWMSGRARSRSCSPVSVTPRSSVTFRTWSSTATGSASSEAIAAPPG